MSNVDTSVLNWTWCLLLPQHFSASGFMSSRGRAGLTRNNRWGNRAMTTAFKKLHLAGKRQRNLFCPLALYRRVNYQYRSGSSADDRTACRRLHSSLNHSVCFNQYLRLCKSCARCSSLISLINGMVDSAQWTQEHEYSVKSTSFPHLWYLCKSDTSDNSWLNKTLDHLLNVQKYCSKSTQGCVKGQILNPNVNKMVAPSYSIL